MQPTFCAFGGDAVRRSGSLQLAVHQFSIQDRRNRFYFVDLVATHFEQVLVQDNQVGLFANLDRFQLVL